MTKIDYLIIITITVVMAVLVGIKVQMAYATSSSIEDLATTPPSLTGPEGLNDLLGLGNNNDSSSSSPIDIFPDTSSSSDEPTAAEFDPNGTLTAVNASINNYTNTQYGFTFLAPSNWNQTDPGFASIMNLHSVIMKGPDASEQTGVLGLSFGPSFEVQVFTTAPYLDSNSMTLKNYTIQEFANSDVLAFESAQYDPGSSISYQITKNQPQGDSWRIEYISSVGGRQSTFGTLVLVKDPSTGYLYKLNFSTDVLDTPKDLPIANKMIESFRFKDVTK